MQNYEISGQLAQQIVNYLQERPFKDVAQLIGGLAQLKPLPAAVADAKDAD